MKICPNCGERLPDKAAFCRNCGSAQPSSPDEAAPARRNEPAPPPPPGGGAPQSSGGGAQGSGGYPGAGQQGSGGYPVGGGTPPPSARPYPPPPVFAGENVPPPQYYPPRAGSARPANPLATGRGLAKMFFLGILTLGIYDMVILSRLPDELNIAASRYDGRKTMPYFAMLLISPFTLMVLPFVWYHNFCDRIRHELLRRRIDYKMGASTFWLWNILGSLILVGPFIFTHKLCKAMNLINKDYNENG